ncbi:hypothetical protein [Streptosporangium sp. NPDC001681]|uniref:hypothetical protein n=1 Tax=Streptosporangium sp. NPDC001681 TaxID=3154395 RepID=UPI00333050B1
MLSTPAALAFVVVPAPGEVVAALEERVASLEARLSDLDADLAATAEFLPRLFLVESEYQRAMVMAELNYVRGLADDPRAGRLDWDHRR